MVKVERPPPDAGTIVKRVRVSMPLLKAVKADNALLDLLLNHLISAKFKRGQTISVPVGAQVLELPQAHLRAERTALAETREENYEDVARQL